MTKDTKVRIYKMLRIEKTCKFVSFLLIPIVVMLFNFIWPITTIGNFLLFVVLAIGVSRFSFYLAIIVSAFFIFRNNFHELREIDAVDIEELREEDDFEDDFEDFEQSEDDLIFDGMDGGDETVTIMDTPDTIFGTFKDCDFYEWLHLKDANGVIKRVDFVGTVNTDLDSYIIPAGTICVPPGLLYSYPLDE